MAVWPSLRAGFSIPPVAWGHPGGLVMPSLVGLQGPAGKGMLLCSCHSCLSPLLTSWVKQPLLVAENGSLFTYFLVGARTHTYTHHVSLSVSEIDEQVEGQFFRVIKELPVALVFLAVLPVTLATCTLLFWLSLYSQYYKFSVLSFVTLWRFR